MARTAGKKKAPEYGTSDEPVKRNIKDSVFTSLFSDKKYLLQLYRSLHPEDRSVTEDDLTTVTLEHVLTNGIYNDLGFMVKDRLIVLVEAQSTWSVNIVVRVLIYLAKSLQEYLARTGQSLYGSRKVRIPGIELYVIYTGPHGDHPDEISLSDEFFGGESPVDVKVRMIYEGSNGNILSQYITFVHIMDHQIKENGYTRETILDTMDICKSYGILNKYFDQHRQEVVDIMLTLYSQEEIQSQYAQSVCREEQETVVRNMLDDGLSEEKVAQYLGKPIGYVRSIVEGLQMA